MDHQLNAFERIARRAGMFTDEEQDASATRHPFESRNIHSSFPTSVRKLFDDGYYAEATFEAFKFLDNEVRRHSGIHESGFKLMMQAFDGGKPQISLTEGKTISEKDEQEGYRFLFAGASMAIRNPRGHEFLLTDSPDEALDHLVLASMLLRRLEEAGYS